MSQRAPEAGSVEEERLAVAIAEPANAFEIRERHRLAPAGVVGDRHHHERHAIAVGIEQTFEAGQVDVALERVHDRGLPAFRHHEVARLGPFDLDVRARRVEVIVVRHDVAALEDGVKEDAFRGAPLVGGDDVHEAGEIADDLLEPVERSAAGVRFVSLDERAPLGRRHGAGAGVGQQIDEHVIGVELEDVVAGRRQRPLARVTRRERDGFDRLDAERLDDRLVIHCQNRRDCQDCQKSRN